MTYLRRSGFFLALLIFVLRAGTIAAADTVLFDYTKTTGPTVVTSSSRWSTDYYCPKNTCTDGAYGTSEGSIIAPSGMTFSSTTLPYPASNYLAVVESLSAIYWSDVMFVDAPGQQSVHIKFYSAKDPLSIPLEPNACQTHVCLLETGGVQTAGTITWTDGSGNFVTDTIQFRSGGAVPSTVGHQPAGVAVNPVTNQIYVVNEEGASVDVVDGVSNSIATTMSVASRAT